nr:hypothetical protein [Tanacetum cinerariifolium]
KNVKEAMTDPAWIESMQEELLQFKRLNNHFFKGTIDPTLFIRRFHDDILVDFGFELTGFSDADYAGCKDTFKSTSGGAQFLELMDYGFHFNKITIYYDSKSAIAISCNPVQHSRTKHIAVRYHFIKEHVEKGTIELYFVKTDYQLADLFTKALPTYRFNYLVCRLVLTEMELELEQSQQGSSHEVLERNEGAKELKRIRSRHFYWLSHSEIVDIEKMVVRFSLRVPNNKCALIETFREILFSIHNDEWKSFQSQHQIALRIRRWHYNLILAESRFKTSCSINKDTFKMKAQGRLLASFQDLEHEGGDIRSQGGISLKDKDLEISIVRDQDPRSQACKWNFKRIPKNTRLQVSRRHKKDP